MRAPLVAALALAALARPVAAQSAPPAPENRAPENRAPENRAPENRAPENRALESRRQAVAVNMLGIPVGWLSAEYERSVGGGATLGLAASDIAIGDAHSFSSVDAKLRYYPGERGPQGFSLGLTAGYVRIGERLKLFPATLSTSSGPEFRTRVTEGPSVGVTLDYNWLVGSRRRVILGLGMGAKRVYPEGSGDDWFEFLFSQLRTYPTMRFVVGIAF